MSKKSMTLSTVNEQILFEPNLVDSQPYCVGNGQMHQAQLQTTVGALNCMDSQQNVLVSSGANYRVRRLTPKECARLQGFPDDWCDGIKHGDSAEYKLWGNGMALPCALYVMEGVKDYLERNNFDAEEVQ